MCFPIASIIAILIWCIIIAGVVAILRLLIAFALPRLGIGGEIVSLFVQVLMIVLWVVVGVAVVTIIGNVILCLIGLAPSIGHLGAR